MLYVTYAELKDRILKPTGTEDFSFIDEKELLISVNDAIKEAESEILAIYEDYFLSRNKISFVNGQAEYALPSNMFATKIRSLVYSYNGQIYTITKFKEQGAVREANKFEDLVYSEINDLDSRYRYQLFNNSASAGIKLTLIPKAKITGEEAHIFYIRSANRMVDDSSVCDIPEFEDFIVSYAKARILGKEGNPGYTEMIAERDRQRVLMVNTLTGMIPDDDNEIIKDLTFYQDMV